LNVRRELEVVYEKRAQGGGQGMGKNKNVTPFGERALQTY